ncbi:PmoA family protein [Paenibacillus sp. HJGM_3]|uniref:DUF6807 domain-containing protein n=1 Tax=Paenibacillus sp. HJGM_3 TaxID=3379816 RepID=UPI0038596D6A
MTTHNQSAGGLRIVASDRRVAVYRTDSDTAILVQQADKDRRPYIHPIAAPDGLGILTEDAPSHHPWQHGLYVGLNDVNGIGFWTEGLTNSEKDGTFHPQPIEAASAEGNQAAWSVSTEWREPGGKPMLAERQQWSFIDGGDWFELDLVWTLDAMTDLRFGQYSYGGLFLRMPYRHELGGRYMNSEGDYGGDAEGRRARWGAASMPIAGRDGHAGLAVMDHPDNAEHPVPWRVDHQLGFAPSRCIAGAWSLPNGTSQTFRHRVYAFCGEIDRDAIEASWNRYIRRTTR